jgi:acyl-CoA synthetase (AMP-forming)/AMP-acid ligase II
VLESVTRTWEAVAHWAQVAGEREALVDGVHRLTWSDTWHLTRRTARMLLALGVQPGDRVALVAMATKEFLPIFLASNKVGACFVGLSPKLRTRELHYLFQDAQPTVIVTLDAYNGCAVAENVTEAAVGIESVRHILTLSAREDGGTFYHALETRQADAEAVTRRAEAVAPTDTALLVYTSGSSGVPKGVMHSHRAVITSAAIECQHFEFSQDTRILLHFPINHIAATVEIGYATVYAGGTIIHLNRFDPKGSVETVAAEKVTVLGQVPPMYIMQQAAGALDAAKLRSVRLFVWSGAATPAMMVDGLLNVAKETGARLMTGYGSTECCGFAAFSSPHDGPEVLVRTAGRATPPVEMRIVDACRHPVAQGETGELAARGPTLMQGYFNAPELTAQSMEDGWYYTGDLAREDEHGNLSIVGRTSEVFKTSGELVHPGEVESVLMSHPGVHTAAVIGMADAIHGSVGVAYIVLEPEVTLERAALLRYCRQNLSRYKVPRHIVFRDSLPLLPNGKVDRAQLRDEQME